MKICFDQKIDKNNFRWKIHKFIKISFEEKKIIKIIFRPIYSVLPQIIIIFFTFADRPNALNEDSRRASIASKGYNGLLGVEKDLNIQEVDPQERARFDQILEIVLSQLEPVCLSEQNFCISFFQLDVLSPTNKVRE